MPCSGCSEQRVGDAVATRLQAARARPQTTPSMSELPPPPSTPPPACGSSSGSSGRWPYRAALVSASRPAAFRCRAAAPAASNAWFARARDVSPAQSTQSRAAAAPPRGHGIRVRRRGCRRAGTASVAERRWRGRCVRWGTIPPEYRTRCGDTVCGVEGPRRGAGRVARACAACAFPCMTATSSAVSPVPFFCSMSAPAASNVSHAMALPDAAAHSSAPASRAVRRRRWRDADLSRLAPGYLPRLPGCLSRQSPSATCLTLPLRVGCAKRILQRAGPARPHLHA